MHTLALSVLSNSSLIEYNLLSIVGEGFQFDYTVNTASVRALTSSSTPDNVEVTFRVDDIALESNETFTLTLDPVIPPTPSDGLFFRNIIEMIIIDSDSKEYYMYEG